MIHLDWTMSVTVKEIEVTEYKTLIFHMCIVIYYCLRIVNVMQDAQRHSIIPQINNNVNDERNDWHKGALN